MGRNHAELDQIWAELFANPELDLDHALDVHLCPLGPRLDAILAAEMRK